VPNTTGSGLILLLSLSQM